MKKLGIALGGGGTRGFAHVGVLKAMEEKGIHFDAFAGTSAGAIVASLYAAGKSADETMEILQDTTIANTARVLLPKTGLASLDNLREKLDEILHGKSFADLEKPLFLAATNLHSGKVEYLHEGNVALAVQASCSIPILFSPVEINGQLFVDGGLLDNVPVEALVDQCERIIAVDIMPIEQRDQFDNLADIALRTFQLSVSMQQEEKDQSDKVIRLDGLSDYHILDSRDNEKIFKIGYDQVKELELSEFTEK